MGGGCWGVGGAEGIHGWICMVNYMSLYWCSCSVFTIVSIQQRDCENISFHCSKK